MSAPSSPQPGPSAPHQGNPPAILGPQGGQQPDVRELSLISDRPEPSGNICIIDLRFATSIPTVLDYAGVPIDFSALPYDPNMVVRGTSYPVIAAASMDEDDPDGDSDEQDDSGDIRMIDLPVTRREFLQNNDLIVSAGARLHTAVTNLQLQSDGQGQTVTILHGGMISLADQLKALTEGRVADRTYNDGVHHIFQNAIQAQSAGSHKHFVVLYGRSNDLARAVEDNRNALQHGFQVVAQEVASNKAEWLRRTDILDGVYTKDLLPRLQQLEDRRPRLEGELVQVRQENERLKQEVHTLRAKEQSLSQRLDAMESRVRNEETRVLETPAGIQAQLNELQAKIGRLDSLESNVRKVESRAAEPSPAATAQIKELQSKIDGLERLESSRAQAMEARWQEQTTILKELQAKVESSSLRTANQEVATLKEFQEKSESIDRSISRSLEEANNLRDDLQAKVDSLSLLVANHEKLISRVQEESTSIRERTVDAQVRIIDFDRQYSDEVKELKKDLEEVTDAVQQLYQHAAEYRETGGHFRKWDEEGERQESGGRSDSEDEALPKGGTGTSRSSHIGMLGSAGAGASAGPSASSSAGVKIPKLDATMRQHLMGVLTLPNWNGKPDTWDDFLADWDLYWEIFGAHMENVQVDPLV